MFKSATESVKEAKASEFPLAHHSEVVKAPKMPKAKKEMPVAMDKADKKVMVTEKGAVAAKKPRAKKAE
jgi:hypothetical protein